MAGGAEALVVARRYGKALLEVVLDQKADPHATRSELEALARAAEAHPDVARALASPAIPSEKKLALVEALLEKRRLQPILSNLLRVLAKNGRISILGALFEAYRTALDAHERVADAEVTTPEPLSDGQKKDLETRLSERMQKTLRLTFRTDPSILGGVVIRSGNVIYDASLVNQLEKLREIVLAGQR